MLKSSSHRKEQGNLYKIHLRESQILTDIYFIDYSENFSSFVSMSLNKRGHLCKSKINCKIIWLVITCILVVISILILFLGISSRISSVQRNENFSSTLNGSMIAESERNIRPALMPNEPLCKCRLPFYPVANCEFCFHIPSHKVNNFMRFDQYSKKEATDKCVDQLQGEIPSSKLLD